MTAGEWLRTSEQTLKRADIATARLDCLVLLEDATGKNRAWLLAHPEFELPAAFTTILDARVYRRAQHVPLAYIRRKAEFYGREFVVNEHTLVPRPETEAMIELLKHISRLESNITSWEDGGRRHSSKPRKRPEPTGQSSTLVRTSEGYEVVWEKLAKKRAKTTSPKSGSLSSSDQSLHLVDIGTGSGAIAITAKLELPEATVIAIDIDEKCLETARVNAQNLGAEVEFLHGNLLEPLNIEQPTFDTSVLLCNLPYVPDNFQINTAATHEPRHALFGGTDGLDLYREMFGQIQENAWKPAYILTESMPPQHEMLAGVAETAGYHLQTTNDFIQLFQPESRM